ncbi:stable plasmid inheritance protein [Escherichia coli]|nr:DUF5431 family protein [Escherichia coli]OXZ49432.1 stable plasmid inheritance protein [Escherichia coli]OXZ81359.1 stable plasmid inheritance protein [Escherichia coli]
MPRQHQISRLPAERQGEVSYETAAKRPYLVRINRVFNALNIHRPDPKSLMRSSAKGGRQGGRCSAGLLIQR